MVTGMGLFALFCIGIVITTILQEFVRSRVRNGKGNTRHSDTNWPAELLKEMGAMNAKLHNIETYISNDLHHTLHALMSKMEAREKKLEKEAR